MNLTNQQLKQIIKEELDNLLKEGELADSQAAVKQKGTNGNRFLERYVQLQYVSGPCSDAAAEDSLRCFAAKLRDALNIDLSDFPTSSRKFDEAAAKKNDAENALALLNKLGVNIMK